MTLRYLICFAAGLGLASPGFGSGQAMEAPAQAMGAVGGLISGQQGSGLRPLPNAIVTLSSDDRHLTASTDSRGRYFVPGLEPGSWRVRVVHVGFKAVSASVQVPSDGTVSLDMALDWEPVALSPILVRADPILLLTERERPPPAEIGEVALRALEGTPGMAEGGLAQVVRSLPGSDPSDPQDVLLMRGSTGDLKLVLLDGAPVYTPFHMAGLVESFDPGALGGASLFLGGAPARFDGGLSYILELHGRSPRTDRFRGTAAADLLTGRVLLEGPLGASTGFLLGARGIHDIGTPLLAQGSSPYGFGDLLGRIEWKGDRERRAYLTGFWNQESVRLDLPDETAEAVNQNSDFGNSGLFGRSTPADAARWGNMAVAGGYRTRIGETLAELKVASSRYEAELPVGDSLPLFAESRSDRTRVTLDFSRSVGGGALRFGAAFDRLNSAYTAMALDSARTGQINTASLGGSFGGIYVEGTSQVRESTSLRFGGRLDSFEGDGGLRFAPRLSLTWMLTDQAALTVAAGRYHQYSNVATTQIESTLAADSAGSVFAPDGPLALSVGAADHLVVSLDQLLGPGLRLGLEGFVKKFTGVAGTGDHSLQTSGVDLRVATEGPRTSGWLGYTLTWFWASDGLVSSGTSPFSARHLLSAGLTSTLTERTGLRLMASYGDGLPYTAVPVARDPSASPDVSGNLRMEVAGDQVLNSAPDLSVGPDEGFLRLEVEIFGRWSPTFSGRTMELRPYLRVLNALNRRDALFYHFDPWRDEGPQPLADLPLLPLVGLEWVF